MSSLEAEVAEKLAQLQMLSAENEMLKLRAAVLEATVASREDQVGDSMLVRSVDKRYMHSHVSLVVACPQTQGGDDWCKSYWPLWSRVVCMRVA